MLIPDSPEKWHTINLFFLGQRWKLRKSNDKINLFWRHSWKIASNPASKGKAMARVRAETASALRVQSSTVVRVCHRTTAGAQNLAKMSF